HRATASFARTSITPSVRFTRTVSPAATGCSSVATLSSCASAVACQLTCAPRRAGPRSQRRPQAAHDVLAFVEDLAPRQHAGGDLEHQSLQPLRGLLERRAPLEDVARVEVELLAE